MSLINENHEDVLVEIPEEEWPNTRDTFKKDWPYAIYPYYIIENFIRWNKNGNKNDNKFIIYCPKGENDDGTIVMVSKMDSLENLHVFTYDRECKRLKNALLKTKIIDWSAGFYVYACHEDHWPHLLIVFQELELKREFDIQSSYHWISKEAAEKFDIECPSDVYIAPLTEAHADIVDDVWPHKYPGSPVYVQKLIKCNGGLGVFSKKDGSLCAWILKNHLLGLGLLQTAEKHQKKGYGKLVTIAMTKAMANEGFDIHTCIKRQNTVSRNLFKKLGFQHVDNLMFCKLEPKLM